MVFNGFQLSDFYGFITFLYQIKVEFYAFPGAIRVTLEGVGGRRL